MGTDPHFSCLDTLGNLLNSFADIGFRFNDISNINGGQTDHRSHRDGVDFDFLFNNSYNIDTTGLERLLSIARNDDNINLIGITYQSVDGVPFSERIKNEIIGDRQAKEVIRNWEDHVSHFHFRCLK